MEIAELECFKLRTAIQRGDIVDMHLGAMVGLFDDSELTNFFS